MNVHVTPRIRVRPRDNGGWELVSEGEVGADIQTIEGAIWKRDDLYYTDESGNDLDPPELRYDRNAIGSYRTRQNAEFSVDEAGEQKFHEYDEDQGQWLWKKKYCGPNEDGSNPDDRSACENLPQHPTKRIGVIDLELEAPLRRRQLVASLEEERIARFAEKENT